MYSWKRGKMIMKELISLNERGARLAKPSRVILILVQLLVFFLLPGLLLLKERPAMNHKRHKGFRDSGDLLTKVRISQRTDKLVN